MILALAAAVEIEPPSSALRLATAEATERLALPRTGGDPELEVLPLDRMIRLRVGAQAALVGARIASQAGSICPEVRTRGEFVELGCRTARIDAALSKEGQDLFLDVHALRGMPWRPGPDGPPVFSFVPMVAGLDDRCPGHSHPVKGECAFIAGKWVEAARHFRRSLDGRERQLAAVRLGDLALIAADPATALAWYERVGPVGLYGRLAQARLCEFSVDCFGEKPKLDHDPRDLPAPLWADLTLRWARVEAFAGRHAEAVKVLGDAMALHRIDGLCEGTVEMTCRRLILSALREVRGRAAVGVIEVFLLLPQRDKGVLAVDMAHAAAEASARLSAPVFGANLLASVAGSVAPEQMGDHLLRTAELYLTGKDYARARVVVDFAQARLDPKVLKSARWASVRRALEHGERTDVGPVVEAKDDKPTDDGAAADLAAALALSQEIKTFLQGAGAKPVVTTGEAGGEQKDNGDK